MKKSRSNTMANTSTRSHFKPPAGRHRSTLFSSVAPDAQPIETSTGTFDPPVQPQKESDKNPLVSQAEECEFTISKTNSPLPQSPSNIKPDISNNDFVDSQVISSHQSEDHTENVSKNEPPKGSKTGIMRKELEKLQQKIKLLEKKIKSPLQEIPSNNQNMVRSPVQEFSIRNNEIKSAQAKLQIQYNSPKYATTTRNFISPTSFNYPNQNLNADLNENTYEYTAPKPMPPRQLMLQGSYKPKLLDPNYENTLCNSTFSPKNLERLAQETLDVMSMNPISPKVPIEDIRDAVLRDSKHETLMTLTESLECERKENMLLKQIIEELKGKCGQLEEKYNVVKNEYYELAKNYELSEKLRRQQKELITDLHGDVKKKTKKIKKIKDSPRCATSPKTTERKRRKCKSVLKSNENKLKSDKENIKSEMKSERIKNEY